MDILDKLNNGGIKLEDYFITTETTEIIMIVNGSKVIKYDKDKHDLRKAKLIIINDDLYQLCNGFNTYTIRSKDYMKIRNSKKMCTDQNQKICIIFNDIVSTFERRPIILQETHK